MCAHVPVGSGKALTVTLAPGMPSLTVVSTQTPAHLNCQHLQLGAGRAPFRLKDTAPLPAPVGLASDARGYFKPGSMDDFGDTGLGEQAEETRGKRSGALLWRETPGLGRAAWAKGLLFA